MSIVTTLRFRLEQANGDGTEPDLSPFPSSPGTTRILRRAAVACLAVGLVTWAGGVGEVGFVFFGLAACLLAFVLPLPGAIVSPLWMGFFGWLVDMVPLVVLIGWGAVVLRWGIGLLRDGRLPRGGTWVLLPAGLLFWTCVGVLGIGRPDLTHFVLLVLIQVVASGILVAVVDTCGPFEARRALATGLSALVVAMTALGVLQWMGVPVQSLQDTSVRRHLSALDTFPNDVGLIKWARSVQAGAGEVRGDLDRFAKTHEGLPPFKVFRPKYQAFTNHLVIRFEGSARPFAQELARRDIELPFDNVGLAPANTVPRMRSIPRNALTYAGVCASLFPFALFLVWTETGGRRRLGWAATASCLFGTAFSLSRGAWAAVFIGVVYLAVEGRVVRRRKMAAAVSLLAAGVFITAFFLLDYGVDPLSGRAGGGASTSTRINVYKDTLDFLRPKSLLIGYGTEKPRTESGTTHQGTKYVPPAGTHSTYLNYLFRLGIPGLVMIAALYLASWLHARRAAQERDGPDRLFYTLAAMAVVIAGLHAIVLNLFVEPLYTLEISLVLGMAIAGTAGTLAGPVWPERLRRRKAHAGRPG